MRANREGLSLIEVIVAMTLLAVVLTSLAGMSFTAAQRSVIDSGASYRHGVMLEEMNRLASLPFATLSSQSGCVNVATPPFPHRRCVLVAGGTEQVTVRIVVQPGVPGVRPDTIQFQRARFLLANPLNTP